MNRWKIYNTILNSLLKIEKSTEKKELTFIRLLVFVLPRVSNPIFSFSAFKNLRSNNNILWTPINTLNFFNMEKFLQRNQMRWKWTLRSQKIFNSRLKVWDFAKILASEFQNLPFDDKSSILKKYYVDMLSKCSDGKSKIIFLILVNF